EQVTRRGNRQELRQSLDYAENDRRPDVVHDFLATRVSRHRLPRVVVLFIVNSFPIPCFCVNLLPAADSESGRRGGATQRRASSDVCPKRMGTRRRGGRGAGGTEKGLETVLRPIDFRNKDEALN